MNTSLLRMRKAIAAFTIGTLLASFLAVPAAFAAGIPDWAMEGANAYLKAETREMGNVAANKCEVAKMIVTALDLQVGENEMQAGAAFQDLQGGMSWCQGAAGAVAVNEIATGNNGVFGAEGSVSRAVVATMLKRAYSLDTFEPATLSAERQAEFAGMEWAQNDMAIAVAAGLIKGDDQGRLNPAGQASKWAVATMLYRAANMGAESTTPATPAETTPAAVTPEVAPTGGALTVSVSSSTPSSATVPSASEGLAVAKFDFTAGSDAVKLTSLEVVRGGFSDDDTLDNVTLLDSEGVRVTKSRTFNSDDDTATLNFLEGGIVVPARSTVELTAVVSLDALAANKEFNLMVASADAVTSNASSVSGSFPVMSNDMRVSEVKANQLKLLSDTDPANPDLGDKDAVIARFKLQADDGAASTADLMFNGITLKETGSIDADEIQNFKLHIDGEEVASAASLVNDFVVFNLDQPMLLEDQDKYDVEVTADIIGGPDKKILLTVDSELDVRADDVNLGFGSGVDASAYVAAAKELTVEAGELTVIAIDAPNLDITDDRDDVVLGTVRINTLAGKELEIQKVSFDVQNVATGAINLDDTLENIEIATPSGVFALSDLGAATTDTTEDDDLSIMIPETGSIDLVLRADTVKDADFSKVELKITLADIGASSKASSGLHIVELAEDTIITDITPDSLTFENLEGQTATMSATAETLSTTLDVVHGAEGVVVHQVKLSASEASAAYVSSLTFKEDTVNDNVGLPEFVATITTKGGAVAAGGASIAVGADTCTFDEAVDADIAATVVRIIPLIEACTNFSARAHADTDKFYVSYSGSTLADNYAIANAGGGGQTFAGTVADVNNNKIDTTRVTRANLYVDSVSPENLIKSTSDFTGNGTILFRDFNDSDALNSNNDIAIEADGDRMVFLTFDLKEDENQGNDQFKVELDAVDADDEDGDSIGLAAQNLNSLRTVTIAGSGTLSVTHDNTDPIVDKDSYVLAGSSAIVASVELTADNEDITIQDAKVVIDEGDSEFRYSKVELLNENMELISDGSESLDANDTATFTGLDYLVAEGTENLYIRLVAHPMGENETGVQIADVTEQLTFTVTKAKGQNSITAPTTTGKSLEFGAVPVQITSVELAKAEDLHTTLTDSTLAAAITIQTAANTSTKSDGSAVLETLIEDINFNVSKDGNSTLNSVKLKRVGNSAASIFAYNLAAGDTVDIHVADNTQETVTINGVTSVANVADAATAGRDDEVASLVAKINAMGFGTIASVNAVAGGGNDNDTAVITAPAGGLFITDAGGNVNVDNRTNDLSTIARFDLSGFTKAANSIQAGESVTYQVIADFSLDADKDTTDFLRLHMSDLSSSAVVYKSNDNTGDNDDTITDLRLVLTELEGVTISD